MNRGRGVVLQRYKEGGLSDAKTLAPAVGLTWRQAGGRTRTELDLTNWMGKRGQTGRLRHCRQSERECICMQLPSGRIRRG